MITNIIKLNENSPFLDYRYVINKIGQHFKNCGGDPETIEKAMEEKSFFVDAAKALSEMITKGFDVYILKYKKEYLGFMYLLENTSEKEITSIYVEERYRKNGFAQKMVSFAVSKGCKTISTYGDVNIKIFKRIGFEPTGNTIMVGTKEYTCMFYRGK